MRADNKVLTEWQSETGTVDDCAELIRAALGCSNSKATKLASGYYFHGLSILEQAALVKLTKKEALFSKSGKTREKAS